MVFLPFYKINENLFKRFNAVSIDMFLKWIVLLTYLNLKKEIKFCKYTVL